MTKFSSAFASQLSGYALFRVSQGYCESTHSIPLRRFDAYCAECHPLATVLTREIALGWFEHESHAGFVVSRQKASALRGFANFINATGGSAYVLPLKMNPPVVRGIPRMPTDKEMSSLFHAVDTTMPRGKYPQGVFSVLFRLVYTCGLRPGEALGLHIADVDLEKGTVRIVDTKFHKDRAVAMSSDMLAFIKPYVSRLKEWDQDAQWLFPGCRGGHIRTAVARRFLDRCWKTVPVEDGGVRTSLRLYDLRHRFATEVLHRWLDEGRDILESLPVLRVYMGHVTILSTLYYVHLLPERVRLSHAVDWQRLESIVPEVES